MTKPRRETRRAGRIKTSFFDSTIDAAEAYKKLKHSAILATMPDHKDAGIVKIKNASGVDLSAFSILQINSPLFTPGDNPTEFRYHLALKGTSPDYSKPGLFAVLQEPIANGNIGKAVVSGITPAYIWISDVTHQFADVHPEPANQGQLYHAASCSNGSARILWQPDGVYGNFAWVVLRLSNRPTIATEFVRCSNPLFRRESSGIGLEDWQITKDDGITPYFPSGGIYTWNYRGTGTWHENLWATCANFGDPFIRIQPGYYLILWRVYVFSITNWYPPNKVYTSGTRYIQSTGPSGGTPHTHGYWILDYSYNTWPRLFARMLYKLPGEAQSWNGDLMIYPELVTGTRGDMTGTIAPGGGADFGVPDLGIFENKGWHECSHIVLIGEPCELAIKLECEAAGHAGNTIVTFGGTYSRTVEVDIIRLGEYDGPYSNI